MDIYNPSEDSFLLSKNVREHAKGKVLDVGTGSGVQAAAASEKCKDVTGVDINRDAIKFCKERYKELDFFKSDLFEYVVGKFDTIIFNPPYLPMDEDDEKIFDPALFGGKEGWETIERFFHDVRKHLNPKGIILLLFSSLTNKEKVDNIIKSAGFQYEQIDSLKLDFEELYVYKVEDES
jgi:release factor glutamine methyltransferase